jgi:hypothetical protein
MSNGFGSGSFGAVEVFPKFGVGIGTTDGADESGRTPSGPAMTGCVIRGLGESGDTAG